MDFVLRGVTVYNVLLVLFRITGKRSLAQITTFDFVLLLIVSEATQQAMIDTDNSMINALLLVVTLLGIDMALSMLTNRSPALAKLIDDVPLVIVEDGRPLRDRMAKARLGDDDVLSAARELQGLERIKYAVLERSGGISIVPKQAG